MKGFVTKKPIAMKKLKFYFKMKISTEDFCVFKREE